MENIYDVIICGGGPAGLTAAIYTTRANLKTLIIEASMPGGKLSKTFKIENYPGIETIMGADLAMQMMSHSMKFGAELEMGEIVKIENKEVFLSDGRSFKAKAVIVATGTNERQLQVKDADKYTGRGISYCAVCDGAFYKDKDVVVIGGGNSALEEALYLTELVSKITIVIRRDVFRAEESIVDKIKNNPKIEIVTKSVPHELITEENTVKGLTVRNVETGELRDIPCSGIFPYIGADPATSFLPESILNENGYIKAKEDMSTDIDGIFAAGDVIVKNLRQVVTACGDGAVAANSVIKYLQK